MFCVASPNSQAPAVGTPVATGLGTISASRSCEAASLLRTAFSNSPTVRSIQVANNQNTHIYQHTYSLPLKCAWKEALEFLQQIACSYIV